MKDGARQTRLSTRDYKPFGISLNCPKNHKLLTLMLILMIHKLFADKGQGPHMLLIKFEAKAAEPVICPSLQTGRDVNVWIWKHKITDAEVCRYLTASGKGYDTGVLPRYLRGLKETTNKVAYERAQVILLLNSKKSVVDLTQSSPSKPPPLRDALLKQWESCFVLLFLVLLCLTFAFLLFWCLFFFLSCCDVFFLLSFFFFRRICMGNHVLY
jgi:hypothetical protein